MSKLFRMKKALTLAQLTRAWSSELAERGEDAKQCEQHLIHILQEDILNSRLDNSGPLRNGRRLGLRCIGPDNKSHFVEGPQLLEYFESGPWVLDHVIAAKEAVLDFAKRRELPPPSWWAQLVGTPTDAPYDTNVHEANTTAAVSRPLGKQPRIAEYLRQHFPAGVPEPGLYPRKTLQFEILKWDPGLKPLDDGTLKKAIDNYNASYTSKKINPK
jgi:hypothetical protein